MALNIGEAHGLRASVPSSIDQQGPLPVGGSARGPDAALDAMARRYLARLLGRAPTSDDAARLPGIYVSDL